MADRKRGAEVQAFLEDLSDLLVKHDVVCGLKAREIVFESDAMLNDTRRELIVDQRRGEVGIHNRVSWRRDN